MTNRESSGQSVVNVPSVSNLTGVAHAQSVSSATVSTHSEAVAAPELPAQASTMDTLGVRMLHVAWMSILLGITLEFVLVVLSLTLANGKETNQVIADIVQKVSWSTFVCMGLALGNTAAKAVRTTVMGILGLLAAPLAFAAAKVAHKSAAQALGVATAPPNGISPYVVGSIKAIEFACLGVAVAYISTKHWGGFKSHAIVGLVTGLVFAPVMIAYSLSATSGAIKLPQLIGMGTNEFLYPIGCALILYAAGRLGTRLAGGPAENPAGPTR